MTAALLRRVMMLETAGHTDTIPRLVLVCRADMGDEAITGIKAHNGEPGLRRLPGESLKDMEIRAIARNKGPGLAVVFANYD